jgi:hypothetical protein
MAPPGIGLATDPPLEFMTWSGHGAAEIIARVLISPSSSRGLPAAASLQISPSLRSSAGAPA